MFEAIGEGHKIMHEAGKQKAPLDLAPFRKIYADFETRKEAARDHFKNTYAGPDRERTFAHMATLAAGEAEKAFDALPVLIEAIEKQEALIEVLIRENIFNSNSPAAHMIDCRTCDYRLNCARPEEQCYPIREMCPETVRKYAEREAAK